MSAARTSHSYTDNESKAPLGTLPETLQVWSSLKLTFPSKSPSSELQILAPHDRPDSLRGPVLVGVCEAADWTPCQGELVLLAGIWQTYAPVESFGAQHIQVFFFTGVWVYGKPERTLEPVDGVCWCPPLRPSVTRRAKMPQKDPIRGPEHWK